jgi:hypothetical protein
VRRRRRNPALGNDPQVFHKHASLRILQDQIYKDKGQLIPLDTLREMILDMAKQARTANWKVVEGGKRRANPARDAAATATAFLRKYGSQALGWAKTAASIHRTLRDRIFWRKVYNCILRSLQRGDPLPNPGTSRANSFGKQFILNSPMGPVYRVNGAKVRNHTVDGAAGWHNLVYPKLVPGNEIWIERLVGGPKEEKFILAHEMMEIALMRIRKWKYQRAHDMANKYEAKLRAGACPDKTFLHFFQHHIPWRMRLELDLAASDTTLAYRNYIR